MAVGLKVGLGGDNVAGMNTQSDRYHWFVLLDGQRRGPLTYDDLTRAAKEGLIFADTPVWRSGWKNWHPARKVKGLIVERAPDQPAFDRPAERPNERVNDRQVYERPVNEAPLAPDDTMWADEQVHDQVQMRGPEEEVFQYAPPQHRDGRRSQDGPPRWEQPQPGQDPIPEEWRDILPEQRLPASERAKTPAAKPPQKAPSLPARVPRRPQPTESELDDRGEIDYRPATRGETDARPARRPGSFVKRTAIGLSAVLLMAGGGWIVINSGSVKLRSLFSRPVISSPFAGLPGDVASLPAVVALQRNDPAAFQRFRTRYANTAKNASREEEMTLARNALRKSVKHLLAISPGDVLLEMTDASLGYLQGLLATNPESCVWLSDEDKGARLTSNLAKDLPILFMREMSVLERVASTNPHVQIAPMSDQDAQPYFEKVLATLRRQNVRTELQASERLAPSEFAPYCTLVIAFYQAVLELPRDDRINVLRNLYAKAAVTADSDLAPRTTAAGLR
jgi:hypothetical protein